MTARRSALFWRDFPTKKAAEGAIRGVLNPRPFGIPFEFPLLSDLIVERHYFCSFRALRPARFRKMRGYGAYSLEGDFSGLPTPTPIVWHPVSWTKCLIAPLSNWDRIIRAMRDRCEPVKASYRRLHPICEACDQRASVEVHHKDPSFKIICDAIRERVSEEDITDCLTGWDWFAPQNFALTDHHKITRLFDEFHRPAELEALCRECHNVTKRRKKSG